MRLHQAYRGGHQGRAGWWLHCQYDAEGVEALKAAVAPRTAHWDEDEKRWWVPLEAEDAVLRVVPGLEAYKAQGVLL